MGFEQLSIFDSNQTKNTVSEIIEIFSDGASRGNPGPASVGFVVKKNNIDITKQGFKILNTTNNVAEYLAMIAGLDFLQKSNLQFSKLIIKADSELLVKQLLGKYRVKSGPLQGLFYQAKLMLNKINKPYLIQHIDRNLNQEADKQANIALDKKTQAPEWLITLQKNILSNI